MPMYTVTVMAERSIETAAAGSNALVQVSREMRAWWEFLRERVRAKDADVEAGLRALLEAALVTKEHLAQHRSGAPGIQAQRNLRQLWNEASVKLRKSAPDLAARCQMKADYWTDPERWTPAQVDYSRIGIDRIYSDAQALLRGEDVP